MDKVYYPHCFSLEKPLFYAVSKLLFAQSFTLVSLIFLLILYLFSAPDVDFAFIAILRLVSLENKRLTAYGAYFGILRFRKLNVKLLVKRKHRRFAPFTDNMRIGYNLRTDARLAVVKQNAIPVVIIAALTADKGVYPSALLRCEFRNHSSGSGFCGGFGGCLPCSFCVR